MIDIAIKFDPANISFDALIVGADLASETGLATAIYISLFTDRRANDDDVLPDNSNDRRGWWGDAFAEVKGDKIGSRLWLLKRSKLTADVCRRAEDYAGESLAWLVEDGVAKSVTVTAEVQTAHTLALEVTITRPDGRLTKFSYLWSAMDGL